MDTDTTTNSPFDFLASVIKHRLKSERSGETQNIPEYIPENFDNSSISKFIKKTELPFIEATILLLALVPHVSPGFLNSILENYFPDGGEFPEFGGIKGSQFRGIFPTGNTVLYILAGNDIQKRIEISEIFDSQHIFKRNNIISLDIPDKGEPEMSGRLLIDEEYLSWITKEKIVHPELSEKFPAQRITTELIWNDLILDQETMQQVREIETWLAHEKTFRTDWNMGKRIKPGYRVLFSGPPGTGKTLTATLLGKYTQKDVYRIDLSMVVSKFIGETEKNLANLFNKAENKNWILFFDEADAIFGKRTEVRDAHDKYANQEVSYLLQRIENYNGLVILASNFKKNIDIAFTRRFQSIIAFKNPTKKERLLLWKHNIPQIATLANTINLEEIATQYNITGANIINAIQYASIQTIAKNKKEISSEDIINGIKKEYIKEGKMM
ncbi:ATP-binding protein [Aquimarina sp. RZ0]|uniref:ATP-binding protein n=1 Tax=Aquimarina sp. RZ0 TaxID=2607730 RepID=UPI0011F13431|nr:ATP-binding protein [Aquimarina sp. RZ0]KAA1248046.1 ATP-binding protein [Aquimarina sp. RZ0]